MHLLQANSLIKEVGLVIGTASALLLLSSYVHSDEEVEQTIASQQKEQIDAVLVDMNNSYKTVVDTVVSEPQKAIDGGCLDSIQGIDLSVMTVDFTDIWGAVYRSIKDEILSVACSAAETWANEQTARLDFELQTPIGNVDLGQGNRIQDWQSIQSTDVQLSNEEISESVTTDTLGNVPGFPSAPPRKRIRTDNSNSIKNTRQKEQEMEETFNLKQIWGEADD